MRRESRRGPARAFGEREARFLRRAFEVWLVLMVIAFALALR